MMSRLVTVISREFGAVFPVNATKSARLNRVSTSFVMLWRQMFPIITAVSETDDILLIWLFTLFLFFERSLRHVVFDANNMIE